MKFCSHCSGDKCCGIVKEKGLIGSVYLTQYDIDLIKSNLSLAEEDFIAYRRSSITFKKMTLLKNGQRNGCIFFDKIKGRCKIYEYRPLDCRLFPLDIEKIEDKYFWILYDYICPISKKEVVNLLKLGKTYFLPAVKNELEEYATLEMKLSELKRWKIVEPLPSQYQTL